MPDARSLVPALDKARLSFVLPQARKQAIDAITRIALDRAPSCPILACAA